MGGLAGGLAISRPRIFLLYSPFSGLLPFFGFVLKLIGGMCRFATKVENGQIEIGGVLGMKRAKVEKKRRKNSLSGGETEEIS